MRTKTIPPGARHLRNFEELDSYLVDFANGRYPFLWVMGRPGTQKTESTRGAMRGRAHYYRKAGQLTPLQLFIDCYHHRGQPIILDDAEHLLDNPVGAKLISALGDTTREKLLCYSTTARALGDVPPTFLTASPLCILANRPTRHEDVRSRGLTLCHDPTNAALHRAVARWYWDQQIFDWFGEHLTRLPPVDTRWYLQAYWDKLSQRDWRQIVLRTHAPARAACIIQDLEDNSAYPTREDKARRFVELLGTDKGASRASYFRLRKRLEDEERLAVTTVPRIQLRYNRPPGTPSPLELEAMEAAPPAGPEHPPQQGEDGAE
jgi:hypothetical protein